MKLVRSSEICEMGFIIETAPDKIRLNGQIMAEACRNEASDITYTDHVPEELKRNRAVVEACLFKSPRGTIAYLSVEVQR